MTDQENENIKGFLDKAIIYLVSKATKTGLNLDNDNFKNNLKEIVNNPTSEYADNVYLFDKIPDLKKQEEELNKQIKTLKAEVDKFNTEIDGKEGANGLKASIEELENKRDSLKKEIDGDKTSEDKLVKDGLLAYRDALYNQIHSKDGLENKRSSLNNQINHLTKKNSIVEKLSELKSEAIKNQEFYQNCVIRMIGLILFSSWLAYIYGDGIIDDITKITNKDSRDYFGMFLMKIPFSLMIITFISGGFIFISKLLVIIERISNQLRNISQISVIASQIDQKTIDLINAGFTEDDDKLLSEAKSKKEEKTLFYNLIAEYLVNLSKNELELKGKEGSKLKMLKELSNIIHQIKK